jgi:hypothetical protein
VVACRYLANVQSEIRRTSERSRLVVQLAHRELPAHRLLPGVLSRNPIKPPFQTTREQEIVFVDRENAALRKNTLVQPQR